MLSRQILTALVSPLALPLPTRRSPIGLNDPARYRDAIERLHERYLFTPRLHALQQDGVSLASVSMSAPRVARLLARSIERGEYEMAPATVRTIVVEGKRRRVFSYGLMDLIVHETVSRFIQEAVWPSLSPQVYSYRQGVQWLSAAATFAGYVRRHRRGVPDPRQRGLYVLRRDIGAYTDSIPVGPRSRVWDLLDGGFARSGVASSITPHHWRLIESVVRPEARDEGGGLFTAVRGVATGTAISNVLFNLYLTDLDRRLDRVPGGFYARYCDDILFAHHDLETVQQADRVIEQAVAELQLEVNRGKSQDLYLTAAGRPATAWPAGKGATGIEFVGARVSADGTVSLNRKKVRALLRDVEQRAQRTARALQGRTRDEMGRLVCAMINRVFDPDLQAVQQKWTPLVRRAVTDRRQLEQLDYWIARTVVAAVTGKPYVRAFRETPYRTVRRDWGLISLLHARNRSGKGRRWTS